jgi:cyclopropane-fatty-acyl-phospholipid synthase
MRGEGALMQDQSIRSSIHFLEQLVAGYRNNNFAVRLWDGTEWRRADQPRFTLVLKHPASLWKMFMSPSELGLGEAFIYDDFDIEGDVEAAVDFADHLLNREYSIPEKLRCGSLLAKLPVSSSQHHGRQGADLSGALHSKDRDRRAVTYHYDVSNDFYAFWLDRSMTYSCAYFKSPEDDLDTAQTQKLEYICKKLRLQRGETILDIGCGWGGLLIYAAKNYGVRARGITLSVAQAELARERIRQAGLASQCMVEVCDYRDLDPPQEFDKLVSVGMFEHVGESLLLEYFRRAWNLLRPGGVFLNHGIAASPTSHGNGPGFAEKHVFPDGELVPINATLRAAEACQFEVRDVENLREHYTLTLRHWVRRLEARSGHARSIVGDITYRVWRLYMSGAAHGFRTGRINLCQVLLTKPDRGKSGLPLTREDWYAEDPCRGICRPPQKNFSTS